MIIDRSDQSKSRVNRFFVLGVITFSGGVIVLIVERLFGFFLIGVGIGIIGSPVAVKFVKVFPSLAPNEKTVVLVLLAALTGLPMAALASSGSASTHPEITVALWAMTIIFLVDGLMKPNP